MKVVTVVGARPQFIKAAPVSRALARAGVEEVLVHTGQHYDAAMSEVFFRELELATPKYHLSVGSGSHGAQTARALERLEEVFVQEAPDMVLVYGDTNSTIAGALAAVKLHIPVAHVEAGLRSSMRTMPEEINRVLTDHISALLLCPTATAVDNLASEGITRGVHLIGDVMYDALLLAVAAIEQSPIFQRLGVSRGSYGLFTLHRAENTDDAENLTAILTAVAATGRTFVFPVHPRTLNRIEALGMSHLLRAGQLRPTGPLPYLEMVALEQHAAVVVTDSGGVQKEAHMLGVPCITCREKTEWVESLSGGANILVGNSGLELVRMVNAQWGRRFPAPTVYGDGDTADRVAKLITQVVEAGA